MIDSPEKIRSVICGYPVSEARKELLANAYNYYSEFKGYQWNKPKFTSARCNMALKLTDSVRGND